MAAMAAAITRPMITATPAILTATATRRSPTGPTAIRATATIDRTVGTMSDTATVMVTGRIGGTATECTAATIIGIDEPVNGPRPLLAAAAFRPGTSRREAWRHVLNLEQPALFNEMVERSIALVGAGRWDVRNPRSILP